MIVENDIYVDLDPEPRPSLASLDQLQRVVYISSFSKTISPNMRVGYLAAQADLLEELAQLKMLSGLTSSEFTERLAYGALVDGRWRKHVKQVRERLAQAHQFAARELLDLGFELFCEPKAGMLLWARHPAVPNAGEFAYKAAEHDIMLGPGHLFSVDLHPDPGCASTSPSAPTASSLPTCAARDWARGRPTPRSRRAAATRQTVLPTSSATSSALTVQRDTDRAAIGAALVVHEAGEEFDRRSAGRPLAKEHEHHVVAGQRLAVPGPCWPMKAPLA